MMPINNNWRELLRDPKKNVFPGFVYFKKGEYWSAFDYVNDSLHKEEMTMVLLDSDGNMAPGYKLKTISVVGGECVHIDTRDLFQGLELTSFVGSLMLINKYTEIDKLGKAPSVIRSVMSSWHSADYHSQIGSGPFGFFNEDSQRDKLTFIMFSPSLMITDEFKTASLLYNYSSQADYNDTVVLTPRINDVKGNHFFAESVKIPPFGTGIFDFEKLFLDGKIKKDVRYSVSIAHQRHTFVSLFFHISRKNGAIITGRHTQPPASILRPRGVNVPANTFRKYVPVVSDLAVDLAKKILGRGIEKIRDREMD